MLSYCCRHQGGSHRDGPKLLNQVVRASVPNARQKVRASGRGPQRKKKRVHSQLCLTLNCC